MVLGKKKKRERDKCINQWNKVENQEISSHKYSQLIFEKGAKAIQQAKIIFSTNGSGTNEYPHVKKSLDSDLQPSQNSKWTIELNTKGRPLKILDDNIGENLIALKFGNNFIEKPMEEISDKLDSIKI